MLKAGQSRDVKDGRRHRSPYVWKYWVVHTFSTIFTNIFSVNVLMMYNVLLCSGSRSATDITVRYDNQVYVLQSTRVSFRNVQQDSARMWRARGRKTLALLCVLDKQDRHSGNDNEWLLVRHRKVLRPISLYQQRYATY